MSVVMDGSIQRKNIPPLKTSPKSRFMNQENPSLKSVEVSSDKDVQREMENITRTLSNADADWKVRRDALLRLQGITIGGATDFESFFPLIVKLKGPLNTQLQDLRSAIPREACAAINLLSGFFLDQFDSLAEYFLPTLFKLVVNSVHFISDAGNLCIRTILQSVSSRADRILPEIFKQTKSTHNTLRTRCIEYILLVLSEYSTNAIDKYSEQLVAIVESGLSDAIPEVRVVSRQCFKALNNHWQNLAQSLFSRLDSSVQKYLFDDHKKEEKSLKSSSSRSISDNLPKPSRSKTNTSKSTETIKENIVSKNIPSSPALMHTFPAGPQLTRANSTSAISIPTASISAFPTSSRVPVTNEISIPSKQSVPAPSQSRSYSRVEIIPQVEEATVSTSTTKSIAKPKAQRVAIDLEKSNPVSSSSSNHPPSSNLPSAQRTIASSSSNGIQRPPSASLPSRPHSSHSFHEEKSTSAQSTFVSMTSALNKANSSLWSTRVEGFQDLKTHLASRPHEVSSQFDKLLTCIIQHTNDAHYKVVQLALESIRMIITGYAVNVEGSSNLEKILICLLSKCSDRKESVRQDATTAIDRFIEKFSSEAIITLLKVLEQPNVKTKTKCLEFLTTIIPSSPFFFKNGNQMRLAMQRIIPLANPSDKVSILGAQNIQQLRQPALQLLMLLYIHYKDVFFTQILLLPIDLQLDARNSLASSIPDVDQQLHFFSHSPIQSVSMPTVIQTEHQEKITIPNIVQSDQVFDESGESFTSQMEEEKTDVVDENDWIQCIRVLGARESLHKIIKYSRDNDPMKWSRLFQPIVNHVIQLSKDVEVTVRELALLALKHLVANQSRTLVCASLSPILMCFLDGSLDLEREVSLAAEEGMQQLVTTVDTQICVQVLEPILKDNSENSDNLLILKSAIKLTSMCIKKMAPNVLSSELPHLIPSLFECLKSGNADVRKTVVFCLVDIYSTIGDDFEPYLAMLSSTQAKLIQIYCKRKKGQSEPL